MFESLLFLGAEAGAGAGEKTRSLSRSKTDQLRNTDHADPKHCY